MKNYTCTIPTFKGMLVALSFAFLTGCSEKTEVLPKNPDSDNVSNLLLSSSCTDRIDDFTSLAIPQELQSSSTIDDAVDCGIETIEIKRENDTSIYGEMLVLLDDNGKVIFCGIDQSLINEGVPTSLLTTDGFKYKEDNCWGLPPMGTFYCNLWAYLDNIYPLS